MSNDPMYPFFMATKAGAFAEAMRLAQKPDHPTGPVPQRRNSGQDRFAIRRPRPMRDRSPFRRAGAFVLAVCVVVFGLGFLSI